MARKGPTTTTYRPSDPIQARKKDGGDEFVNLMLERAQDAFNFDSEQRRRCVEDMKFAFVSENQWDSYLTTKRRNKPNYEFNRIRQLIRRVTGLQLKNKPNIKVRAVEDNDRDTADIYNGLIKNIEVQSSAENAYDSAFQWACGGGFGVLRVIADYEPNDSFDQRLIIKTVQDPMTCFPDPSFREYDGSDARFWFITELIPIKEFKKRWPNKELVSFDVTNAADSYDREWFNEEEIRIAEYWYKEPGKKTIYMLTDGSVVDAEEFDLIRDQMENPPAGPDGQPMWSPVTIKNGSDGQPMIREMDVDEVYSCLVYGKGQLEKPTKWGGSMIPIVPQWGDVVVINGKRIYSGMTRFGRDAQQIHNFEMSTMVEVVSKLPNSPLKATPVMIKGLESYYERLGYDDPPVLLYNHDPMAPGASPSREPMAQLPTALSNLAAISSEELKATLGVYDASLGAQSNETSGRAIMARNSQADTTNFVYVDNQVKALKRLGEILVDAIPAYYDAERSIRILGEDMGETYVKINHPVMGSDGQIHIENDLTKGRFDVVCTVGKSYDTARMELADLGQTLAQTPGPIGAIGQYLLFKSLDVPGIDMYIEAVRKQLVNQGILPPSEGDAPPPPPPPPNPKDVAQAEHHMGQAALAHAKAQQIAMSTPSEIQKNEAQTAETISKIPGHEAKGQQTALENNFIPRPMPMIPMGTVVPREAPMGDTSDVYTGGY